MPAGSKTALRSRQWSCGDLARGAQAVKRVKRELPDPEDDDKELAQQIQARSTKPEPHLRNNPKLPCPASAPGRLCRRSSPSFRGSRLLPGWRRRRPDPRGEEPCEDKSACINLCVCTHVYTIYIYSYVSVCVCLHTCTDRWAGGYVER